MSPDGSPPPPPEEKLLKLIRSRQEPRPAAGGAAPGKVPAGAGSGHRTPGERSAHVRLRWPQVAIGALSVLLMIEVVLLALQISRPLSPPTLPAVDPSVGSEALLVVSLADLPSLASSVSPALFVSQVEAAAKPVTKTAQSEAAKLLASRLNLMGIVSGDPAQAIIQDSQTQKTYFVAVGQTVVEDAVLQQVKEHGAVLDLNGETIELML